MRIGASLSAVDWRGGSLHRSGLGRQLGGGGQALDQPGEMGAAELPLERPGRLLVASLEGQQALLDGRQAGKVVGVSFQRPARGGRGSLR
jgi:hypothetical protein